MNDFNPLNFLIFLLTRSLDVPAGDILIHAGDFTNFGDADNAKDFNEWLGDLPHPYKIVVNGNHESNAPWKNEVKKIVSNATYLIGESHTIEWNGRSVKFYGTNFFWPMKDDDENPHFKQIDEDVDILVAHGPVDGYVDSGKGCGSLLRTCQRLQPNKLKLVISGHMHQGYGIAEGTGTCSGIKFVNGSNCGRFRKVVNAPIVVTI